MIDITNEYDALKKLVLEKIPDTFTINNNVIEEQSYNAILLPINFNPYRMGGRYYPTFYECTPRVFVGKAPTYTLSKGEETTISIWNAILKYREYDLLADLFILGFLHDSWRWAVDFYQNRIDGYLYTIHEAKALWQKARDILEENRYGRHNPRCKTYLTLHHSEAFEKYWRMDRDGLLKINNIESFVEIMMEIITDAYSSRYFIVKAPSDESVEYADRRYSSAVYAMQENIISNFKDHNQQNESPKEKDSEVVSLSELLNALLEGFNDKDEK